MFFCSNCGSKSETPICAVCKVVAEVIGISLGR